MEIVKGEKYFSCLHACITKLIDVLFKKTEILGVEFLRLFIILWALFREHD